MGGFAGSVANGASISPAINVRSTISQIEVDRQPVQLLFADTELSFGPMTRADSGTDLTFTVPDSVAAVTTPSSFPDYDVWDLGPMSDFLGQSVTLQVYDVVTPVGTGMDVCLFFGLYVATDPTAFAPGTDLGVNMLLHFGHSSDDNDESRYALRRDNLGIVSGTLFPNGNRFELAQRFQDSTAGNQRRAWEFFGYDGGSGGYTVGSDNKSHSAADRLCAVLLVGRRDIEAAPASMQLKMRFFGRGAPISTP